MDNDTEIMKEYREVVRRKNPDDEQEIYRVIGSIDMWLPDAVKRDRVKLLKKLRMKGLYCFEEISTHEEVKGIDLAIFDEFIAENSPRPSYCEGMQEAIDKGYIGKVKMQSGGWRYSLYVTENKAGVLFVKRCPFCKEGENCIGGTHEL